MGTSSGADFHHHQQQQPTPQGLPPPLRPNGRALPGRRRLIGAGWLASGHAGAAVQLWRGPRLRHRERQLEGDVARGAWQEWRWRSSRGGSTDNGAEDCWQ
jgi:hypothetical protein